MLELGRGNGRTYDHLRSLVSGRAIYVCERPSRPSRLRAAARGLILAASRTAGAPRLGGNRAGPISMSAPATPPQTEILAAELMPLVMPLLCAGAILVADRRDSAALETHHCDGMPRRYLYRRVGARSAASLGPSKANGPEASGSGDRQPPNSDA